MDREPSIHGAAMDHPRLAEPPRDRGRSRGHAGCEWRAVASSLRSLLLAATTTLGAALVLGLGACAPGTEALGPGEGVGGIDDAVSGTLAVGTTLIATTDVNLRSGPGTGYAVLHVVPAGDSVTLVSSSPSGGFYNVTHKGVTGWSSGTYYKVGAPPPSSSSSSSSSSTSSSSSSSSTSSSGGTAGAADLLAALGACQQIAGTTLFRKDAGSSKTVPVCSVPGAVWWTADLDVDCDGGTGSACLADPDYQAETATVDSHGNPLDASTLPYVVVPMSSNGFDYKAQGLKLGSVVAVIYKGQVAYGILGDIGPAGVIGEASYAMAKLLGINPSPTSGGVDSGVTYVAFTGSSAVVSKKEDHAAAVSIGQAKAAALTGH
jgi:hypothetical protein